MSATVLPFRRKRALSLAERAAQLACEKTTEKLKTELAINLSEAFRARREKVRQFGQSAGLML